MKNTVDQRLLDEAHASSLRFRCDDCAHFDTTRDACSHGYPVAPHRPGLLCIGTTIVFCKEFELGAPADAP